MSSPRCPQLLFDNTTEGAETTEISSIVLHGTAISGTNVSALKKLTEE